MLYSKQLREMCLVKHNKSGDDIVYNVCYNVLQAAYNALNSIND